MCPVTDHKPKQHKYDLKQSTRFHKDLLQYDEHNGIYLFHLIE